jgi:hypothetical protein
MTTRAAGILDKYFYFSMSLLIAVLVIFGFSQTVDHNLIHAVPTRPWILYLHAVVFPSWVVFFILQTALVRTRNVRLHRKLGWFGVALGAMIPVLGISTAITMTRFDIRNLHVPDAAAFMIVPFWDVTSFTIVFALAVYWRRNP